MIFTDSARRSNWRRRSVFMASLLAAGLASGSVQAGDDPRHPGRAVYDQTCATCHDNPEATRSPSLTTLKQMRVQSLTYALNEGKMKTQAAGLSSDEKRVLIEYLAGMEQTSDEWIAGMMCPAERRTVDTRQQATVTGFGFNERNDRHLTREQAGLKGSDFRNLELAWAIAFPGATTMRSQPAVMGSTLFLPVADAARMFAFNIDGEPCIQWVYQSEVPLRTSASYDELEDGRPVVVVGDLGSNVHMVDARTGQGIWTQHVGFSELSVTTGTPVIHKDKVIVPISQFEIMVAASPEHECCTTHGAVTALDAATGKEIWTAHTMEDAKPVRDRGDGQMIWGPSGAPIWNSPLIDEKRGMVYVGTGEATSEPAHKHTDAILGIDLETGDIKWSFQATENDIFIAGCGPRTRSPNCPRPEDTVYRDVDFGASLILAKRSDGSDLIVGGQKSGTVWALDPDKNGAVVWRQDFGEGSPLGGIHWGIAFDGQRIFAPINRPYGFGVEGPDKSQKPGMHAVRVDDGKVLWTYAATPDCSGERKHRVPACDSNIGLSGAPTVIDGVVVEGALDGMLRALNAKNGKVLFQFDTAQSFDTINGVEGKGGAIDNASIVAANGYLFVNSGYGMFGQMPGNVLLAFKPK
ncbi:outer membrane protein assembly factor BamB family protein [Gilvimarinus sp. F26214L]|uniref:outer membrane protein assembly factor BamB family protein n=1 Tax=Gilvimarinus sp. DZF01 TaxID=3461371 RepID=UPI0040459A38